MRPARVPQRALLFFLTMTGVTLTSARCAMADEASPVTWTVRAPPDCSEAAEDLAREVDLACDAMGHTCRVVARGAERVAILSCPRAARWTVEARDDAGARLWTMALEERPENRLRVAAMWLARAERDLPPPDAPIVVTPVVVPQAPPEPAAHAGPAHSPAARDSMEAGASRSTPISDSTPRGGVALAARGALGGDLAPGSLGASARVVVGAPRHLHAGLAVSGERAFGAASRYDLTTARVGAAVGWGAPWSEPDPLGASVDAGVAFGYLSAPSGVSPASATFASPYVQLSLFGRWRTRGAIRPWLSLSVAALADTVHVTERARDVAVLPRASAALEIGAAWAAW